MLVVLDTNVLVSGLLKAHSAPGEIVRLVAYNYIQLAYDARIINEYREVMNRPRFGFEPGDIEALIDQIKDKGTLVSGTFINGNLPDPSDKPFIEVAMSTKKRTLITGNKKHFPENVCSNLTVLEPSEFMEVYRKML